MKSIISNPIISWFFFSLTVLCCMILYSIYIYLTSLKKSHEMVQLQSISGQRRNIARIWWYNNWYTELKEMNKDKIGEPFYYPNIFHILLVYAKVISSAISANWRRNCTRGHTKWKVPSIPDYTTISRRINKANIKIQDKSKDFEDNYLIIAIDSTGIKVINRGQWKKKREREWNGRKEIWKSI
jgi:hypothetical protein